jgi:hypothetical protein
MNQTTPFCGIFLQPFQIVLIILVSKKAGLVVISSLYKMNRYIG